MSTDLAKLVVTLEAQSARYQSELEKARGQLSKFEKSAGTSAAKIGAALAATATAAAVGLTSLVKKSIENADALNRLSQSAGVSVEELSRLGYAAALSDVSTESLASGLARLSKNIGEGVAGTKEQAQAFKDLGINIESAAGFARPTGEVFLDVAGKLSLMEDGAKKNMVAQALFGRSYQELIPILNQGKVGLEKLGMEADALGVTISGETATAADDFGDQIDRIKQAAGGLGNKIMAELLPPLKGLADGFLDVATDADKSRSVVDAAVTMFKGLASVVAVTAVAFTNLGRQIAAHIAALKLLNEFNFTGAVRTLVDGFKDSTQAGDDLKKTLDAIWNGSKNAASGSSDMGAALAGSTGKARIHGDAINKITKETKKHRDELGEAVKQLEKQAATLGMSSTELAVYEIKTLGAKGATLAHAQALAAQIAAFEAWNKKVEEGKSITEAARTPAEALAAEEERLRNLATQGAITWDTYSKALESANKSFADGDEVRQKAREQLDKINSILAETPSGKAKALADELETLRAGFQSGMMGDPMSEETKKKYDEAVMVVKLKGDEMTQAMKSAAENMQSAFADFLFDPFSKGLGGMLEGFTTMLRRMLAEAASAQIMKAIGGAMIDNSGGSGWMAEMGKMMGGSSGGSSGGWGWIGSLFSGSGGGSSGGAAMGAILAGGFASGGVQRAGEVAWVGENGPELTMAPQTRTIMNNRDSMGLAGKGGSRVIQNFNISTPNADSFRMSERQIFRRARMGLNG